MPTWCQLVKVISLRRISAIDTTTINPSQLSSPAFSILFQRFLSKQPDVSTVRLGDWISASLNPFYLSKMTIQDFSWAEMFKFKQDFIWIMTRKLLKLLKGRFGFTNPSIWIEATHGELNPNVCNVKDLLTEAFKSEPGPVCREHKIAGKRGSFVPG